MFHGHDLAVGEGDGFLVGCNVAHHPGVGRQAAAQARDVELVAACAHVHPVHVFGVHAVAVGACAHHAVALGSEAGGRRDDSYIFGPHHCIYVGEVCPFPIAVASGIEGCKALACRCGIVEHDGGVGHCVGDGFAVGHVGVGSVGAVYHHVELGMLELHVALRILVVGDVLVGVDGELLAVGA